MSVSVNDLSVAVDGFVNLERIENELTLAADASFSIDSTGIVTSISLAGGIRKTRSGPGYTLDGKFYLEINTTSVQDTVVRAGVNRTNGSLSGSQSFDIDAHTIRIGVAGSFDFDASSLFSIHGYAELSFGATTGLDVAFDAGFSFLGTSATVTGAGAIAGTWAALCWI